MERHVNRIRMMCHEKANSQDSKPDIGMRALSGLPGLPSGADAPAVARLSHRQSDQEEESVMKQGNPRERERRQKQRQLNLKFPKINSLAELRQKAETDPRYAKLAMLAASNLGGPSGTIERALQWLYDNAMETDEQGVVDEVNFVRDLVC